MRLGDLDELKEKVALMWGDNNHITKSIYEIIDNAPTVEEVSIIEFKEPLPLVKAQKILRALNKRPQGEWLNNKVAFHFTCDNCGCNIRQLKSEVFEGDYDYNFCPNCGTKMNFPIAQ